MCGLVWSHRKSHRWVRFGRGLTGRDTGRLDVVWYHLKVWVFEGMCD